MSDKTKIEWTEATWNPTTGCDKVSPGCKNCYAKRDWARLSANEKTVYYGRKFEDVATHEERLILPLRWTKPRLIFVNSMSDLFHQDVPQEFIQEVWVTMALARARGHRFQILTKRAERMPGSVAALDVEYIQAIYEASATTMPAWEWPLPNVWLGVSVEDQPRASERVKYLRSTDAAVRWVSYEPALGPVDWYNRWHFINWLVCGFESGPDARPGHPDLARQARDFCQFFSIPFLFKQWGEHKPQFATEDIAFDKKGDFLGWDRVGKKAAGRELDGRTWDEYPK
ncbi:MAG: phage Gp37/Gp68 family protein [Blastocatellales bacterium]